MGPRQSGDFPQIHLSTLVEEALKGGKGGSGDISLDWLDSWNDVDFIPKNIVWLISNLNLTSVRVVKRLNHI